MTEFDERDPEIAGLLAEAFPYSVDDEIGDGFLATAMEGYRQELRPYFLKRIDWLRRAHHEGFPLEPSRQELSRIIDNATTAGLDDVVAKANVQMTKIRRHAGEFGAARLSGIRAVELSGCSSDLRTLSIAHFELGMVEGSGEGAEGHFAEAERCLTQLCDGDTTRLEAKILYGRGRAKKKEGDLPGAIWFLDRSRDLYKLATDDYGLARVLSRLGYYQRLTGHFDEAESVLEQAQRVAHEHGFKRVEGYAYLELGQIARVKARYKEAHSSLSAAWALFEQMHDPLGEAHTLAALAAFERSQGHLDEALRHAAEAHRRYKEWDLREINHTSSASALTLRLLGECLSEARRFTEAEQVLNEALGAYRALNQLDCLALTLSAQAKLMAARGDGKAALDPAGAAIDLLAQIAGVSRQGTDNTDLSTPHMSCYLVAAQIANDCNDDQALVKALSGAYQEVVLRSLRISAVEEGATMRDEMLQLQSLERSLREPADDPGFTGNATHDLGIDKRREALLDQVARQEPLLAALLGRPLPATAIVIPSDQHDALAVWLDTNASPCSRQITLGRSGGTRRGVHR